MTRRRMLELADATLAAWNRGDPEGVVADMAEDVIWRDVALGLPLQGRPALVESARAYLSAFPDLRIEVTAYTVDGLRLVQEWTSTGTHQGDFMGIAPTSRWIEIYGALAMTCDEDGRVIEGAVYWNPLAMFRQLGVELPIVAVA